MRLPKVAYRRIVCRDPRGNKKLGKRAPHGVASAVSSPSNPTTATRTISDTMSDKEPHRQSTPNNGNPTTFVPPTHSLPPRPSLPPWVNHDSNVSGNSLAEMGQNMEAYRRNYAQLHQQRPVGEQFPLSNSPPAAPPSSGAFAGTQSGLLYGNHPLSHWFTGLGPFDSALPPPNAPPPFFAGHLPPPGASAGVAADITAQNERERTLSKLPTGDISWPFGRIPFPSPGPPFPPPSAMLQPPATAPEAVNDSSVAIGRKDKHKDPKIYLPAPIASHQYLLQASLQAEVRYPPTMKLVILDLNGTLLYRPNSRKQPRKMIARPFLPQFLAYLFDNFVVMVWSSAKPENVQVLVEIGLGEYQNRLIACWARDTLGLEPRHYNLNVQCYKNLHTIWASDEIQRHMRGYESGARFDQRNTILIDDSSLKAAAQPHNLLEIPEFKGVDTNVPVQDVLAEVAGYLEVLKMQEDVSKFIHKDPFRANGDWRVEWTDLGLH